MSIAEIPPPPPRLKPVPTHPQPAGFRSSEHFLNVASLQVHINSWGIGGPLQTLTKDFREYMDEYGQYRSDNFDKLPVISSADEHELFLAV